MIEAEKAAFSFTGYNIPIFSYNEPKNESSQLTIKFEPSGVFFPSTKLYEITFSVIGYDNESPDDVVFLVVIKAKFEFQQADNIEDIPEYFYTNSIAILFPYLRAFISTLTLQANESVIVLDLLKLTNLSKPLKDSTVVSE